VTPGLGSERRRGQHDVPPHLWTAEGRLLVDVDTIDLVAGGLLEGVAHVAPVVEGPEMRLHAIALSPARDAYDMPRRGARTVGPGRDTRKKQDDGPR